jgi:hypothetical protein
MATIERHEDIQGWQRARELTKFIYAITKQEAFVRDFSLKDQIRRAAVSVMSNIAEGFEQSQLPRIGNPRLKLKSALRR